MISNGFAHFGGFVDYVCITGLLLNRTSFALLDCRSIFNALICGLVGLFVNSCNAFAFHKSLLTPIISGPQQIKDQVKCL